MFNKITYTTFWILFVIGFFIILSPFALFLIFFSFIEKVLECVHITYLHLQYWFSVFLSFILSNKNYFH
jgi:hypothetical protein